MCKKKKNKKTHESLSVNQMSVSETSAWELVSEISAWERVFSETLAWKHVCFRNIGMGTCVCSEILAWEHVYFQKKMAWEHVYFRKYWHGNMCLTKLIGMGTYVFFRNLSMGMCVF